jgi:aminomethyltransferase
LEVKKTPFHDRLVELGGRMVAFAGFHMPMQFAGIVEEHLAVRTDAGIFDVSHMGEISISGDGAADYVNKLTTNDVAALDLMQVQYTAMLNDEGGVIDDLLVYRRKFDYLLVVNAVNVERDFGWMSERAPEGVKVRNLSDETAQVAVQGPGAVEMVAAVCDDDVSGLGSFRSMGATIAGVQCLVSRTGYTGEDGLEIYTGSDKAGAVWDAIMKAGSRPVPIGLGARDSLRLEAAFRLHGSDMDETTTPLEAGLGWIVKLDNGDFFGKEVLLRQKAEGVKKRLIGLLSEAKRFPRPGYGVWSGDREVGRVTSGGFAPSLKCGIALAYVEADYAKRSTEFQIDLRGQRTDAKLVRGPFYKRPEPE